MTESIFIKKQKKEPFILDITEVMSSVPEEYFTTEQKDLQYNKKEIRWRFFTIDNKKYVEISVLNRGRRVFIDKFGKEVNITVNPEFDKYLEKQRYYYPNE